MSQSLETITQNQGVLRRENIANHWVHRLRWESSNRKIVKIMSKYSQNLRSGSRKKKYVSFKSAARNIGFQLFSVTKARYG